MSNKKTTKEEQKETLAEGTAAEIAKFGDILIHIEKRENGAFCLSYAAYKGTFWLDCEWTRPKYRNAIYRAGVGFMPFDEIAKEYMEKNGAEECCKYFHRIYKEQFKCFTEPAPYKRDDEDTTISPAHYKDGGIETIDFIEAKGLNFCRGNAVKYISRAGKKDAAKEIEDLKKAVWYLEHEIKRLEGKKW